tara:strand:- start:815 stop:1195 length:381 start_codon:yes stop_codon:yes gene_type:complete
MKNEFVPYEEALALKELGFDEECFKSYQSGKYGLGGQEYIQLMDVAYDDFIDLCHAPLYQQAFRWFREKYGLVSHIKELAEGKYSYKIERWEDYSFSSIAVDSWEEARLDCLRKLIDIVKHHPLYF